MAYKIPEDELVQLINSSYSNKDASAFVTLNGYTVYSSIQEKYETIENFEVFDDDVWVATFPRSGTTWTQEMVWCIMNNLNFEGAQVEIDTRFPFFEKDCILMANTGTFSNTFPGQGFDTIKNLPRPRLIKTHLPWELLPKQIRTFEKRPKVIHVSRDPRDVCVSFYHQNKMFHGFENSLQAYCKLFLNDKILWTPFYKHLNGYLKHINEPNILCINYEEMQINLVGVVINVSKFLRRSLTDDDVCELCNHISFDSMKDNTAVNRKIYASSGQFMRIGKTGTYKFEMDEEVIAHFAEWMKIFRTYYA